MWQSIRQFILFLLQFKGLMLTVFILEPVMANDLATNSKTPAHHHETNLWMPDSMKLSEPLVYDYVLEKSGNKKARVVCQTCHGIEGIEKQDFQSIDKQDEDFLRGGPYAPLSDFCYLCHQRQENQAENIHILLDEQGEIKKQQCLYCHQEVLKTDSREQQRDFKLRLPQKKICYGCHLRTPHLNAIEHQVKVPEEMREQLLKSERQSGVHLPLGSDQEITCVTCHDPHQSGVLERIERPKHLRVGTDLKRGTRYRSHPWEMVYERDKRERLERMNQNADKIFELQYQRISYEVLLRLPAKNGALCLACHSFSHERKAS